MIKVLIVEDSPVARELLKHILTSTPQIQVVGAVDNGMDALRAVVETDPDVITMDIHMPKLDGFEATRRIMATHPKPIVIVSGSSKVKEVAFSFKALEAGALAVVPRPLGLGHPEHLASARELIQTVRLMSEIKVVARWASFQQPLAARETTLLIPTSQEIKIAALGASTGGPLALRSILAALPPDLPFPLCIVQHIARGFTKGLVEWLTNTTGFPLLIASPGEYARPGCGYVAPDDFHLGVASGPRIELSKHPPENGLRPSVSHLFRSVARAFGPRAVGVLLTGMGSDGAAELKLMRDAGAVTVVQDQASSVVHGMPGAAIDLGAASHVLAPAGVAALLIALAEQQNRSQQ